MQPLHRSFFQNLEEDFRKNEKHALLTPATMVTEKMRHWCCSRRVSLVSTAVIQVCKNAPKGNSMPGGVALAERCSLLI
jgi:hypothetical protein